MTQRPTAVRIPTPCAQPWATMMPTPAGRHCAACQTQVVAFTHMTQAEVINYLAARAGQRVCAKLATPLVPIHPKRMKSPRRWLLIAAVLLGWQLASAAGILGQTSGKTAFALPMKQTPTITIRGIVLNKNDHQPIPGTSISLKNTTIGVSAGPDGTFEFTIPTAQLNAKTFKIAVHFIGYDNKQIKLGTAEPGRIYDLRIALRPTVYLD